MMYDQDDEDYLIGKEKFEIVRKILAIFNQNFDESIEELLQFSHSLTSTGEEKFITVHPNKNGDIVFCVLTPEQIDLIGNICEFSKKSFEEIIPELAEASDIPSITLNPKEY